MRVLDEKVLLRQQLAREKKTRAEAESLAAQKSEALTILQNRVQAGMYDCNAIVRNVLSAQLDNLQIALLVIEDKHIATLNHTFCVLFELAEEPIFYLGMPVQQLGLHSSLLSFFSNLLSQPIPSGVLSAVYELPNNKSILYNYADARVQDAFKGDSWCFREITTKQTPENTNEPTAGGDAGCEKINQLKDFLQEVPIFHTSNTNTSMKGAEMLHVEHVVLEEEDVMAAEARHSLLEYLNEEMSELDVARKKILKDAIPETLFFINREGFFTDMMNACKEDLALPEDRVIGSNVYDLMAEPDKAKEIIRRVFESGKPDQICYDIEFPDGVKYFQTRIIKYSEEEVLVISRNVTEEHRLLGEAKDKSEFIQLVFDTTPNLLYVRDAEGKTVLVNQAYTRLVNKSVEELYQLKLVDFHTVKEEVEIAVAADEQVITERKAIQTEELITGADGKEYWFKTVRKPLTTPTGEVYVLGILTDITALVEARQQLREIEALHRTLSLNSRDIISLYNSDGAFLYVSQAVQEMLGYMPEELIGTSSFDIVHPKDRQHMEESFVLTVVHKKKSLTLQHRQRKKDGSYIWVEKKFKPIVDSNGEVVKVQSSARDITDRHIAREELEKNEKKYKDLFDFSNSGIYTHDLEGHFLSVNPAFCKSVGYQEWNILGKKLNRFAISKDENLLKKYLEKLLQDNYAEGEVALLNSKHEEVYISYKSYLVEERGRDAYVVCNTHDITERVLMEKELKKAKEQAEESAQLKQNFLANMSHEIRTPMNGILGISNLLAKTSLDKTQENYVNIIHQSADNLLMIVNDILDLGKINANKLALEEIHFNVEDVLQTARQVVLFKAEEKEISLTVTGPELEGKCLKGDPYRLNQVLLNLMTNAIKFTPKGEVSVSVCVLEEKASGITLEFAVADTGIGIPKEKQELIFEEFTQAYANTTRKFGGTGLGLNICKKLVEMQGGRIWVESQVGKGSVFKFVLTYPLSDAPINNRKKSEDYFDFNNIRVLLAEDNEVNVLLAETLLENRGCQVEVAPNGQLALERASVHRYDVILMDIQMPVMSGVEATRHIRSEAESKNASTPIIALTANIFESNLEDYLSVGMNDYLFKPFKEDELFSKIAALLPEKLLKYKSVDIPIVEVAIVDASSPVIAKPSIAAHLGEKLSLSVCNLHYLEEIADGNTKFMREMISLSLQQVPTGMNMLKHAVKTGKKSEIKAVAHKLKSTIALIGAEDIRAKLLAIEELTLTKQGITQIRPLSRIVEQQIWEANEELKLILPHL